MNEELVFGVLHLFAGIGGGALGFQRAVEEWRGIRGRYTTLAGIDVDPEAIEDFRTLTGAPGVQMDLFTRQQYVAFHGHEPPEGWREANPEDIRRACGGTSPDVVFLSPPCKGFSGLLPAARAKDRKYQALNGLVARGMFLTLEAFPKDRPGLLLLENVPRITIRGADLLLDVKRLLAAYGYVFHEGYHDCGELGGLGQHRRRYLLVARHPGKVPSFVYQPPKLKVRACGEVLGPLPLPDDPAGGPMHRLPRLQWRTWVRLALIPAGGDWRDLGSKDKGWFDNSYRVVPWDEPAGTVTTGGAPSCGATSVADPRFGDKPGRHLSHYRVEHWDDPAHTVTGATHVGNGTPSVADPRLGYAPRKGAFRVARWDEPATAVIGAASVRGSNGVAAVADPRFGCAPRNGSYGVLAWDEPATTIIGSGDVHAAAAAVADPRLPEWYDRPDPPPVIVALDGTWHRPLTTLEMAALQGFPEVLPDGRPLQLTGRADSRWRERIGNAVPPPAAQAIAETLLRSLIPATRGVCALAGERIWVAPGLPALEEV